MRGRDRVYEIDATDGRVLATIGAFRVVSERDLHHACISLPWRHRQWCDALAMICGRMALQALPLSLSRFSGGSAIQRFGKPCLVGTRIDVATIVGAVAAGDTMETVAQGVRPFPRNGH